MFLRDFMWGETDGSAGSGMVRSRIPEFDAAGRFLYRPEAWATGVDSGVQITIIRPSEAYPSPFGPTEYNPHRSRHG
jgi:hypothetical protein